MLGDVFVGTKQFKGIFSFHPRISNRLVSRESTSLEFKQSFNWGSKIQYAKTMAAFSNNRGGYIVFGVQNSPRNLIGLTSDKFEEIDEAKVGQYLNSIFSPEIKFEKFSIEVESKHVGILYTYPCEYLPVVSIKNDGDIKESEIYYRYNATSEKIKYPELIKMIDEIRIKERQIWKNLLEKITRVGPSNAAILDIVKGKIEGKGGSLLIDKNLISKLKFIREGQFTEKGAPTLKLVGTVEPVTVSEVTSLSEDGKDLKYRISDDPHAFPIRLEEKTILEEYPYGYGELTEKLRQRYSDFKATVEYHRFRKQLKENKRYCITRLLDPGNAKSAKKDFYNPAILKEFDKHYTKKSKSETDSA